MVKLKDVKKMHHFGLEEKFLCLREALDDLGKGYACASTPIKRINRTRDQKERDRET